MSNGRASEPISVPESDTRPRRGSIADLFSKRDSSANQAAANQANQQRRLSITTLGLSGSPTQASTFGNRGIRRGSLSSSWGSAPNEDAVTEDLEGSPPGATPNSPFARRVSFGAQALREARTGSIGNGRYPPAASPGARPTPTPTASSSKPRSPASISTSSQDERSNPRRLGEGFNWSEALRSRAERAPSVGGPVSPQNPTARQNGHQRAASIASMEHPVREIPKQPKQNKPDFFQEKILRGDFMD